MAKRRSTSVLADLAAPVTQSTSQLLARGYRDYERYEVKLAQPDGTEVTLIRDLVRGGRIVAVLPIDPARQEVVLLRQFRLSAQLVDGTGDMVEIVAGRVEAHEDLPSAARRECVEEIGVEPGSLIELFTFLPTPGLTDEAITVFLGVIDASAVPERAGAADELEETRPMRVSIDDALAALPQGRMRNGSLVVALQWLAVNRHRIGKVIAAAR